MHETILPHSNLVQVGEFAKCLNTLKLPTLVVTRGMALKSSLNECEEEDISIDSSEDSPCRNPTLAKCGGEAQHFQSWGFGVLRDSRMFRVRQQGPKHLALRCS